MLWDALLAHPLMSLLLVVLGMGMPDLDSLESMVLAMPQPLLLWVMLLLPL